MYTHTHTHTQLNIIYILTADLRDEELKREREERVYARRDGKDAGSFG